MILRSRITFQVNYSLRYLTNLSRNADSYNIELNNYLNVMMDYSINRAQLD